MSDMLDVAPSLPRYEPEGEAALLQGREPSRGEFLAASVATGWWNTTVGQLGAQNEAARAGQENPAPLSREEWEASGLARPRLQWQEGMTRGRAEAMARIADERAYRETLMAARDPGALDIALGFGGQMLGSIPDPVNFVPIAGPLSRGLRGVGAARSAAVLAAPGVGASALRGVVDAVGGNVLAAPLVYASQEQFGEEITFDRVLMDLAVGAAVGGAFGTVGGLISRRVQPDAMASVRVLDMAARDLAAGRTAEVPMPLVRASVEDAVMRSAPVDLQGVRLADLPAAPDGGPVSRAEFAAMVEQARRTQPVTLADLEARDTAEARAAPQAASVEELLDFYKGGARPRGEKSLTQFVVEQGGIRDERGDVSNMMGAGSKTRPGLLNNARGLPVDEMAEKARLAGYFPEFGAREGDGSAVGVDGFGLRPFLEALDEDLNKTRQRFGETEDARAREMQGALADLDEVLRAQGIDITAPRDVILRALRDLREDAPGRTLDDLVRDEEAYGWYREALAARQHMDRMAAAPAERVAEAAPVRAEPERAGGERLKSQPPTDRLALLLEGYERTWADIARDRGDGLASPWLTETGRFLDTGGDHISLASRMDEAGIPTAESYSGIAMSSGALSMQFGPGRDGYSVYVRIAESQRITPQQMQAIERLMREPGAKLGVSEVAGNEITRSFRGEEARMLLQNRISNPAPIAPDPETAAALQQIEALRAEGRISPADDAILRAGAEQADELAAVADGLEEAGACLLRNLT